MQNRLKRIVQCRRPDGKREQAFPAEPDNLLVHHVLTIHRPYGNMSELHKRRAMGLIDYATSARPDKQAHADYQKRLGEEMVEAGHT